MVPIDAPPTAKLRFATNMLPQFSDKGRGIWRRMILVPFDKQVPEDQQNPKLAEELIEELPGIFNSQCKCSALHPFFTR